MSGISTALVLAGHGSHISAETAGLIWRHVDTLRAMGIADEVTAAFWKEPPTFSTVLSTLAASDITVVPVFTAQGYFTQTVIPAEMGLDGALTMRDGRTIRYAPPLSAHPYLSTSVQARIENVLATCGVPADQVGVAILGHSTRRNPASRLAAEAQAADIQATGRFAEVVTLFLDDAPGIEEIYRRTTAPTLIAVPYFLALGSHTTLDVPARLGLPQGATRAHLHGRDVIYTLPVGIDDQLLNVIVDLARGTGAPLRPLPEIPTESAWTGFPRIGTTRLDMVLQEASLRFGELCISVDGITHHADSGQPNLTLLRDPGQLRDLVRGVESGVFRSLPTTRDLPRGWRVTHDSPAAVIETIYPGALADWDAVGRGGFVATPFNEVIARQQGMFKRLAVLDEATKTTLVTQYCGNCVRTPTWFEAEMIVGGILERLPCAEPCNTWLSAAYEPFKYEREETQA